MAWRYQLQPGEQHQVKCIDVHGWLTVAQQTEQLQRRDSAYFGCIMNSKYFMYQLTTFECTNVGRWHMN